MTTISIFYPTGDDIRFDFEYYTERHMPRSIELLSRHPGFRTVRVEKGVAGREAGSAPPFVAVCHFTFVSLDSFLEAFTPHAVELQGDIPNYTNAKAIIQIAEVLMEG